MFVYKFFLKILIILFLFVNSSWSENFDNVLITGNDRISNETILVFSELPDNNFLDENSLNNILKKLYNSGFFSNVQVKLENKKLMIDVVENPIIQTVHIDGIKKEKTKNKIYDILLLKDRSSFNVTSLKNDEINIINE